MRSNDLAMKQIPLGLALILITALAFAAEDQTPARISTNPTTPKQAQPTDFGARVQQGAPAASLQLADARALQRQVDAAVQNSVAATNALRMISGAERQELQTICNSLAANPSNAEAQRGLAIWLGRHKGLQASIIAQFCLATPYKDLQTAVGKRVRILETGVTGNNALAAYSTQTESRRYQTLSNILKSISDTAQSMINNLK